MPGNLYFIAVIRRKGQSKPAAPVKNAKRRCRDMNTSYSAKRVKAGALDAKLQAILRKQVPVTPNQRRRAVKAGLSVGVIMHSPVGTKRSCPLSLFLHAAWPIRALPDER